MKPLRHPSDFYEFAAHRAGSQACEMAIRHGAVTPVRRLTLPNGLKGWRFTATSEYTPATWLVLIWINEEERSYRVQTKRLK